MENRWIRFAIAIVVLVTSFFISFKYTSDLDEVENRLVYRLALGTLLVRGTLMILLHDALGIFPLE